MNVSFRRLAFARHCRQFRFINNYYLCQSNKNNHFSLGRKSGFGIMSISLTRGFSPGAHLDTAPVLWPCEARHDEGPGRGRMNVAPGKAAIAAATWGATPPHISLSPSGERVRMRGIVDDKSGLVHPGGSVKMRPAESGLRNGDCGLSWLTCQLMGAFDLCLYCFVPLSK